MTCAMLESLDSGCIENKCLVIRSPCGILCQNRFFAFYAYFVDMQLLNKAFRRRMIVHSQKPWFINWFLS